MLLAPTILVVDDDPGSLTPLTEALTRRYGGDYQVAAHASASDAITALERMRQEVREFERPPAGGGRGAGAQSAHV